jgi:hypothetical protein
MLLDIRKHCFIWSFFCTSDKNNIKTKMLWSTGEMILRVKNRNTRRKPRPTATLSIRIFPWTGLVSSRCLRGERMTRPEQWRGRIWEKRMKGRKCWQSALYVAARWVVGSSPVEGTGRTGGGTTRKKKQVRTSQKYSINLFLLLHNLSNDFLLLLWICYTELAKNVMATASTWNISQMLTCEMNGRRINWNCNLNTRRTYVFLSLCSLVFICFFRGVGGALKRFSTANAF